MGAAQSAAGGPLAPAAPLLLRLACAEPIALDAPFWDSLFSLPLPLASLDPADVEDALAPHCRQLLVHNPLTHNCQGLLLHTMELLAAAQGGAPSLPAANALHLVGSLVKGASDMAAPSTVAALFDTPPAAPEALQDQRTLMPAFTSRVVAMLASCKPSADEPSYLLALEALRFLLLCFATQLHAASTAAPPEAHPLAEALMDAQGGAAPLATALLSLVVDPPAPPPGLRLRRRPGDAAAGGYAVTRMAKSAAAAVLWAPVRTLRMLALQPASCTVSGQAAAAAAAAAAANGGGVPHVAGAAAGGGGPGGGGPAGSGGVRTGSMMGDMALVTLLLAAHFPAQHSGRVNPVREALVGLQDLPPPASSGGADALAGASGATASFARLYSFFSAGPPCEGATLLLYSLLQWSRSFRDYLLVRSDVETLLLPLLRALYASGAGTANHLYMLQIVVLILSQDSSFSNNIHKVMLASVPWFKERMLGRISLGSLVYVVLLRTAMHNFGQLRDLYLPTNTLAALANLAPHVSGLHAHAAQRLVALAGALGKRYLKVVARLDALAPGAPPGGGGGGGAGGGGTQQQALPDGAGAGGVQQQQGTGEGAGGPAAAAAAAAQEDLRERLAQDEEVLAGFLRIVLEVINTILAAGLARNPELVYAVLHKQEVFGPLKAQPKLRELVDNIQVVVDYFSARLDAIGAAPKGGSGGGDALATAARPRSSQPDWSVRQVLELVQGFAAGWRPDRLRPLGEMRFVYEEEAAPEEFFVPYAWGLAAGATNGGLLHWDTSALPLLVPLAAVAGDAPLDHQVSMASAWSDDGYHPRYPHSGSGSHVQTLG